MHCCCATKLLDEEKDLVHLSLFNGADRHVKIKKAWIPSHHKNNFDRKWTYSFLLSCDEVYLGLWNIYEISLMYLRNTYDATFCGNS